MRIGVIGRLDRFQRRHRAIGFPLAVIYKFVDDQGGFLAALIAYYAFVSLFPLLLLASTVLGIVLSDNPDLQQQILGSALRQLPVIGDQLERPQALSGGTAAIVIGAVGSLYGGLGVSLALQNALDTAWAVPRNLRPDPITARLRGVALLLTVGAAVVGLTVVGGFVSVQHLGPVADVVVTVGTWVVTVGAFAALFRFGTVEDVSVRHVLPGAVVAALGWVGLQNFGSFYVSSVVEGAGPTTGVFAIVLGLVAFLHLTALLVVFAAQVNVVLVRRLYPRALLTPFTDDVDLTDGDRLAYTAQTKAMRAKGFQDILVRFRSGLGGRR